VAGAQKGIDDERNLWPDTIRAVREVMPGWCVFENVPGLLTHKYFGRIIGDLAESGYIVEWNCISAALFGLPHIRTRLILVAYTASSGWDFLDGKTPSETQEERLSYHEQSGYRWQCKNGRHSVESVGWSLEPGICGSNAGVSSQMDRDRIHALGNAVVPQVAEWIGKRILEVDTPGESR
jgi:DNA (cytosine-5)-methyltransferase 1